MTSRAAAWAGLAAAAALGALAWANGLDGAFQYDDAAAVLDDRSLDGARAFVADLPRRVRPVTRALLLAERARFGAAPAGYHAVSLALHAACALLLVALARRLGPGAGPAGVAGALFLVQPVTTEAVTYVSGQATLLASGLALLAILLYARATDAGPDRPVRARPFAAALLCFALALGAKETAAALPLLLLAWDAAGRRLRWAELRRVAVRRHGPFWLLLAVALATGLAVPRYRALLSFSFTLRPFGEDLLLTARAMLYELSLVAWPGRLNVDHDLRADVWLREPLTFAAPALVAGALAAALRARRWPAVGAGVAWWVAASLPAHAIVPRLDLVSERNVYLPLVGLAIALAGLGEAARAAVAPPRRRQVDAALACAAALVLAGSALATRARNRLWADPVALWADAAAKSPGKARPHENLGSALLVRGDVDGALRAYRRALELEPGTASIRDGLARAWERKLRAGAP